MIIVMEENATEEQIVRVVDRLVNFGFDIHRSTGARYTILGAVGARVVDTRDLELLDGVSKVVRVSSPYKLAARAFKPEGTKIKIKDVVIGGEPVIVMAGPGAIESREQIETLASAVSKKGVRVLRSSVFRVNNDPFGFQGLGEEGLKILAQAADRNNLLTVSEITDSAQLPLFLKYVDMLQVGSRSMQNLPLLRELGRINKPVLLTRSPSSTIEETLMSADYLMTSGNHEVMICESGIRTFETYTRNTLDISAIPIIKKFSHLPVLADPSQGTGRRDKIPPMARAAVAAGADGLLVELHEDPDRALCDGAQSLTLDQFEKLIDQLRIIAPAVERRV